MMDARSGDTRRPQFTPRDQNTQTTRVPHDQNAQTTPAQKRSARR
ncbi:hypothetical protein FHX72_002241 [Pseudoclavibacter helvolus]|uniref:Uncharacterized protein n=1 Tax=Pseudoclavibacter helvolus TaxID=255205 RepID=A0A7W4YGI2_9MICO|nr:hypothetical protein [Pseudoclavibacter helvolus]